MYYCIVCLPSRLWVVAWPDGRFGILRARRSWQLVKEKSLEVLQEYCCRGCVFWGLDVMWCSHCFLVWSIYQVRVVWEVIIAGIGTQGQSTVEKNSPLIRLVQPVVELLCGVQNGTSGSYSTDTRWRALPFFSAQRSTIPWAVLRWIDFPVLPR